MTAYFVKRIKDLATMEIEFLNGKNHWTGNPEEAHPFKTHENALYFTCIANKGRTREQSRAYVTRGLGTIKTNPNS